MPKTGAPPDQHARWMEDNWKAYKQTIAQFNEGLLRGTMPVDLLPIALQEATMVHLNALDSDNRKIADMAAEIVRDLSKLMSKLMRSSNATCSDCTCWWNRYKGTCMNNDFEVRAEDL